MGKKAKLERKLEKLRTRGEAQMSTRSYREVLAVGGQNSDWPLTAFTTDSDVWQNIFALRARSRDLWATNSYFSKYRELLGANVFGESGIMYRGKIKETEDRVIHSADEKWAIIEWQRRVNKVRQWAAQKTDTPFEEYRALTLADRMERASEEDIFTKKAVIKVGEPDLFANKLIQDKWMTWQGAKFCDARRQRSYWCLRLLRLWAAARDGDFFIRTVEDVSPLMRKTNPFGFTLQMVNSEWCDHFYNATLTNGNEVRMGIEYQKMSWGLGPPVAYYFIRRQPQDWQFSIPGAFNFSTGVLHDRIDAKEVIHYARYTDADGTRPAPWCAPVIPKSRHLDMGELAEVIAMRAEACKTGWLHSTMIPEGGTGVGTPEEYSKFIQTAANSITQEPGGMYGLPYGVEFTPNNPTHPNGNFSEFRDSMLRSWCAGMPGADYNSIANDLQGISFSSGRLGRLDSNEMWKLLQNFDIQTAENEIFERWLMCSLFTGAVPLPVSKFDKFNKKVFTGRRWPQVDEVKQVNAAVLRIANNLSTHSIEAGDMGKDWQEILIERAEELMAMEEVGVDPTPSVTSDTGTESEVEDETEGAEEEAEAEDAKPKKKPVKPKKINGKKKAGLAIGARLRLTG